MSPIPEPTASSPLGFFRAHTRALSFGILLTLFSSFGQTFAISLFVPDLLAAFALDSAGFGALYGAATLCSAASLPFFGALLDRTPVAPFTLTAGAALAAACLALALAPHVAVLGLGLLALRVAGQGLMTLVATTTMARAFGARRGTALAVASLGYPLGEALLPSLLLWLRFAVGWRIAWCILASAVAGILLPAAAWLARAVDPRPSLHGSGTPGAPGVSLLRDPRFFLLLPGLLFLPLVLTALFLYQLPMAAERGWPAQTMAAAFVGFATARVAASLWIGPLVDRWGAIRLFPFVLVPICAGLLVLAAEGPAWTAFVYLALAGASQGFANPIGTALWAEIYGVESLGAIKGKVAMPSIVATAAGPLVLGWVLARGVPFATVVPACAALGGLCVALGFASRRLLRRAPAGAR